MKKLLLMLMLTLPFFAAPAHALPMVYGTAEKSVKVADLPGEEFTLPDGRRVAVGYCYEQFQLFWIPLWNWNEKYCGYVDEKSYTTASYEELIGISKIMGLDTSWDDGKSKIPLWERIGGKVVLIAILLCLIAYSFFKKRRY